MDIGSPPLRITQDRVNRISNNPPEILTDKGGYESKIGSLFFNLTGIDDGWIGRKDLLQAVFILLQGKFRIHPVLNFPLKVVRCSTRSIMLLNAYASWPTLPRDVSSVRRVRSPCAMRSDTCAMLARGLVMKRLIATTSKRPAANTERLTRAMVVRFSFRAS